MQVLVHIGQSVGHPEKKTLQIRSGKSMAGTNEDDAGGKRAARDHWNLDFIAALSRPWSSIDTWTSLMYKQCAFLAV